MRRTPAGPRGWRRGRGGARAPRAAASGPSGAGPPQDPQAERRPARTGGPRLPGSFLSRFHHGAVQPPSSPLPLPSERVRNRGREGAGRAGGPGAAPERRAAGRRRPCFVVTRQPGFGALPDRSRPWVTCVVIASVRFELIHLGLLMSLGLLYTLDRDFSLLNFPPPPFSPKKDIWKPVVGIRK